MSQLELGEKLGVTAVSAGRYCRGERQPTPRVAKALKALTSGAVHAGNFDDDVGEVAP